MNIHCIYKTKINYPTKPLAEVLLFILHYPVEDIHTSLLTGSLQCGKINVNHIHTP